jgi:hypothetical protein
LRVVADPAALDAARWRGEDVSVLRFAPDDALGLGASAVDVDDVDAIVEAEAGYVGVWLSIGDLERHLEWPLPTERPALAQGAVAGVPAKVWLPADGPGNGRADGPGNGRADGPGNGRADGRTGRNAGPDGGTGRGPNRALLLTAAAYAAELDGRLR